MSLEDFDDAFDAAPGVAESGKQADITVEQFRALAAPQLPCGLFTLTLTDGARKLLRVRLERGKWLTGQRTLSLYCKVEIGGERKSEWETLGVVSATGFNVFKKFRGDWEERWAVAIWALANGATGTGYSLEIVPTCWVTNRKLRPGNVKCGLCETWRKAFGVSR